MVACRSASRHAALSGTLLRLCTVLFIRGTPYWSARDIRKIFSPWRMSQIKDGTTLSNSIASYGYVDVLWELLGLVGIPTLSKSIACYGYIDVLWKSLMSFLLPYWTLGMSHVCRKSKAAMGVTVTSVLPVTLLNLGHVTCMQEVQGNYDSPD